MTFTTLTPSFILTNDDFECRARFRGPEVIPPALKHEDWYACSVVQLKLPPGFGLVDPLLIVEPRLDAGVEIPILSDPAGLGQGS